MTTEPSKRIWLYPDRTFTRPRDLEIIVLGAPLAIAPLMAELRATIERWEGFESVHAIMMGDQLLGFRATRSKLATYDDPVAEAMHMLGRKFPRIEWVGEYGMAYVSPTGVVGVW